MVGNDFATGGNRGTTSSTVELQGLARQQLTVELSRFSIAPANVSHSDLNDYGRYGMNLYEFCLKCYHGIVFTCTCIPAYLFGALQAQKVAMDPLMSSTIYCAKRLGN
jgi:hypothetical protein